MYRLKQSYRTYIIVTLCAFMFSLLPEIGFSLGFGKIKLNSYLNEPLDAEIELEGAEDIDTSHLIVSLASVEDFKRIELARPYFLSKLRFEVVQQNKKAILKVTSDEPVKQPYLEFLVLVTWADGRVVRDYTLLLDPAPFGEVSRRDANEQALQMVNKVAASEPVASFQDSGAVLAAQQNSTKQEQENLLPPIELAKAESTTGINDTPVTMIIDSQKQTNTPVSQIVTEQVPAAIAIQAQKTSTPISVSVPKPAYKLIFGNKQILLASGLVLLLAIPFIAWFLKHTRARVKVPFANNINTLEAFEIFDEEIKLKLELANQYLAYQDIKNAEAILDEIVARGNSEEIKLAKSLLKKINRA